jgi:hypothetical protein
MDRTENQQQARELFAKAAAALAAVTSPSEAEPQMSRFLQYAKAHPERRAFIIELFTGSLASRECPWEFIQFCLHGLRWPEMRALFEQRKAEAADVDERAFWMRMLDAFDDDWEDAEFYQEFNRE